MVDSLKFDRPVSANIGKYEIICSLSHSLLIPPSPVRSILMRAQEKDDCFLAPPRTSYKDKVSAKTIKTALPSFQVNHVYSNAIFSKKEDIPEILKFQIKVQNKTGKFSLCFQVVRKMIIGVLVAIGVVIAKAP